MFLRVCGRETWGKREDRRASFSGFLGAEERKNGERQGYERLNFLNLKRNNGRLWSGNRVAKRVLCEICVKAWLGFD